MSAELARPSVAQVAALIRARTKDSGMNEVGTFDEETRPTADEVERLIDGAEAIVGVRIPPLERLPERLLRGVGQVVALYAACSVEKGYWPEQVRSDRSNYSVLWEQYTHALEGLGEACGDYGMAGDSDIAMIPVGSWTSIGGWCPCGPEEEPTPEPEARRRVEA